VSNLKQSSAQMRSDLDEAKLSTREKEERIRSKVDELLAKIEGT